MWDHCVNDNIRQSLQFQISTNITVTIVIVLVPVTTSTEEEPILTAVQSL